MADDDKQKEKTKTVHLDEKSHLKLKIKAAKAGKTIQEYLADLVKKDDGNDN